MKRCFSCGFPLKPQNRGTPHKKETCIHRISSASSGYRGKNNNNHMVFSWVPFKPRPPNPKKKHTCFSRPEKTRVAPVASIRASSVSVRILFFLRRRFCISPLASRIPLDDFEAKYPSPLPFINRDWAKDLMTIVPR